MKFWKAVAAGAVAVMVIVAGQIVTELPRWANIVLGLLAATVFVLASVWLGRRAHPAEEISAEDVPDAAPDHVHSPAAGTVGIDLSDSIGGRVVGATITGYDMGIDAARTHQFLTQDTRIQLQPRAKDPASAPDTNTDSDSR